MFVYLILQTSQRFSFSGKERLRFDDRSILDAKSQFDGKAHALFVWWELGMDFENEIILSCAPEWAHPTPKNMQVRIR